MRSRRPLAAAAACAAALALAPSTARAGFDDERWYGYQVGCVDVLGWGLFIGGFSSSSPVPLVGLGTVLVGGPIVHAAHGNFVRSGISFGLRVGGPVVGAAAGLVIDRNSKAFLPAGPFIGALVGSIAASVIDIAVLAYDPKSDPAAARALSIGGRF